MSEVRVIRPIIELRSDQIAVHPQDIVFATAALEVVIEKSIEQGESAEIEQMALKRLKAALEV